MQTMPTVRWVVVATLACTACSSIAPESSTPATGVLSAQVRAYNTDDIADIYLNGVLVAEAPHYQSDTGLVDISSQLVSGTNTLRLVETNTTGDYTWGFDVYVNGNLFFNDTCGAVSPISGSVSGYVGCDNGASTLGVIYNRTVTLVVP